MKKMLLAVSLMALSHACFAQQVTLVCKGWGPVYERFDDWPINGSSDSDSLVIEMNTATRTAKYLTQLGQIITKFDEKDGFYFGSTEVGEQALGKFVTVINLSMNRMTGGTHITYKFQNEQNGKVAFTGTCAPGKPLF